MVSVLVHVEQLSSRLGALVEVDEMPFSGRLRVGIAPGTSLLQVGTIPKHNISC